MTTYPEIFSFVGCPILGYMGADAEFDYVNLCEACGREDRILRFFHYRVDSWSDEAIVTTDKYYAVTDVLRDALRRQQLRGFSFRAMKLTKSAGFESIAADPTITLPHVEELVIESRLARAAQSPSGWWDRTGACPVCGRPFWQPTENSSAALMAALQGKVGPPRLVARAGWDGADIFNHEDPGHPLVTAAFVDVLQTLQVPGVIFHPATWV